MNLIEELRWRGMIHDITPGTEEQLSKEMTSGYAGFDPTAPSLHIGNLVPVMLLVHLQRAGHKPFVLVGGATGRVGDPSGKSDERKLLSIEDIEINLESQKKQLMKFLDFENGENKAEIVNNYDWFKEFNFLDFIRDVGKHITINYMLAKDSVKKRLETGMSFTEFSYQLVQGYDFYWLHQNRNVKLQVGGSDQWGNITTGKEFIRRKNGGEAFAMTCPLITKADGSKFGKSEGGNIWLDAEKTSPYKFYQYWLNVTDIDAENFIKIFTLLSKEEIEKLIEKHKQDPGRRLLQKELAKDITIRVHSKEDYEAAVNASQILFGKGTTEMLQTLSDNMLLSVFEGVPQQNISRTSIVTGLDIVELLSTETGFFPSKSEVRRLLQGNSISVNKTKVKLGYELSSKDLLNDRFILIQKGKKNYYLIIVGE
jgi:tyrosyl-tRNA synthetase